MTDLDPLVRRCLPRSSRRVRLGVSETAFNLLNGTVSVVRPQATKSNEEAANEELVAQNDFLEQMRL